MNGEQLKIQLLKIEPTLVEVANKLGVSKQNLDAKLSASDIKTGLLERLAVIYERPISFFFGEEPQKVSAGNGCAIALDYAHASVGIDQMEHDELIRLREENKYLKQMLAERDETIKESRRLVNHFLGQA